MHSTISRRNISIMMKLCSLASGSSGNCIYVGTDNTSVLIDAGISCKRMKAGLESIGIDPCSIDGILITHEHSDHIRGLGVVSRRYSIPIYTTGRTRSCILSAGATGPVDESLFREISPDADFIIGDLVIHPFSTSHDAVQPVCYTFTKGLKKISVATDLGCYDDYVAGKISNSNILFIEANHDVEMLKNGSYPFYLKKRILSDAGHLSNEMSGRLISEVMHDELKYVILGHLSKENNRPDVAHASVLAVLDNSGPCNGCIELIVSERETVSKLITI